MKLIEWKNRKEKKKNFVTSPRQNVQDDTTDGTDSQGGRWNACTGQHFWSWIQIPWSD